MPSKNTGKENNDKEYLVKDVSYKDNLVSFKINKKKFEMSLDVFESLSISEGSSVPKSFIEEIEEDSKYDEFYRYALSLLKRDGYTSFELRKKLWKKGASSVQCIQIIDSLEKENLLNDEEFPLFFLENISSYKLIGKNKVISYLVKKGVSSSIIENLEFKKEDEIKKAFLLVEKLNKKLSKNPDKRKKEKILDYLLSQGFDYEIAKDALVNVTPNDKSIMRAQLKIDYKATYNKFYKHFIGKELRKKIINSLMNKGYEFEEIVAVIEEEEV